MKFTEPRRSVLSAALLLFLGVTLVGHVCALPLHDHEAPPTSQHTEDQHHDGGDSVHAASCEAVRSTAPAPPCVPQITTAFSRDGAIRQSSGIVLTRRPTHSGSPPLFLLHSALLI
jgi:hypothetical protein